MRTLKSRLCCCLLLLCITAAAQPAAQIVPGTVVDHIPASSGTYIGSPGLCILPNGTYVASHDLFGPKSTEYKAARTLVFISTDKGRTWKKSATLDGQFWSNLFEIDGRLYLLGTNKAHGNVVIRRSDDEGRNWTTPSDSAHGVILEGEYHTAPMPVAIYRGRIWRAVEYATSDTDKWPARYSAVMLSTPVGSDLLDARNWRRSESLAPDFSALGGSLKGWLEGNAVIDHAAKGIVDILRVHTPGEQQEYAAIVRVSRNGKKLAFDAFSDLVPFPGGSKKFAIRYDEPSKRYWTLVNATGNEYPEIQRDRVRNRLVIASSPNLREWTVHKVLLSHPDPLKHGFQYVEWQVDGNDIVYVVRTAFDDEEGNAVNYHNTNYMTFHRLEDFRTLASKILAL